MSLPTAVPSAAPTLASESDFSDVDGPDNTATVLILSIGSAVLLCSIIICCYGRQRLGGRETTRAKVPRATKHSDLSSFAVSQWFSTGTRSRRKKRQPRQPAPAPPIQTTLNSNTPSRRANYQGTNRSADPIYSNTTLDGIDRARTESDLPPLRKTSSFLKSFSSISSFPLKTLSFKSLPTESKKARGQEIPAGAPFPTSKSTRRSSKGTMSSWSWFVFGSRTAKTADSAPDLLDQDLRDLELNTSSLTTPSPLSFLQRRSVDSLTTVAPTELGSKLTRQGTDSASDQYRARVSRMFKTRKSSQQKETPRAAIDGAPSSQTVRTETSEAGSSFPRLSNLTSFDAKKSRFRLFPIPSF